MNHNHFPSAQQGDTNGVGEDEVAVTSGRHTHAERKKKPKEKTKLHPAEAQTKIRNTRNRLMISKHGCNNGGAALVAEGGL